MISSDYRHIGAGVAEADGQVYYTIDVGYIAGDSGPRPGSQPTNAPTLPGGTPAPTAIALVPITAATPNPDGSIVHVVQYGQFLENIAKAYGITLSELLEINYMNQDTVIFPGDKLLIMSSTTPNAALSGNGTLALAESNTPTGSPSRTPTAQPRRSTPKPPPEEATQVALAAVVAPDEASSATPGVEIYTQTNETRQRSDFLLVIVFVLAVAGGGLIALGSAIKRAV
jgi:hypothetical protein